MQNFGSGRDAPSGTHLPSCHWHPRGIGATLYIHAVAQETNVAIASGQGSTVCTASYLSPISNLGHLKRAVYAGLKCTRSNKTLMTFMQLCMTFH